MIAQNYSEIIRTYRNERAWTQEQLAEIAGLSVRTVQRIETGENCSFETLKSLADAFDIDVQEIIKKSKTNGKVDEERPCGVFLSKVSSAEELFRLAQGCHAFDYNYDPLSDPQEKEFVGQLLDYLKEFGDMMHDLEPSMRMKVCDECQTFIDNLDIYSLWVFAGIVPQKAILGGKEADWFQFSVIILRNNNPVIINAGSGNASIYFPFNKTVRLADLES